MSKAEWWQEGSPNGWDDCHIIVQPNFWVGTKMLYCIHQTPLSSCSVEGGLGTRLVSSMQISILNLSYLPNGSWGVCRGHEAVPPGWTETPIAPAWLIVMLRYPWQRKKLTVVILLQTNLHPSKVYESVGGRASQRSTVGYMHISWQAVIHPVPPCSWHATTNPLS